MSPALPSFTPPSVSPFPLHLTDKSAVHLASILAAKSPQYDPGWHMLRQPLGRPLYHTKLRGDLWVHSTRASFEYAVELLDSGEDADLARAEDILRATLPLQDVDPESGSFGIWPWFAEEPVREMAPPDWNWADFCGVRLLQIALTHRDRLPPDLAESVDAAIARACFSIRRRSMGYDYTNIALMGIYVTLIAGETYSSPDLVRWALGRLNGFTAYTRAAGGFLEFNSPTYTFVAIDELGRLRAHARTPEARPLIEELYHTAWSELARHFHAPTAQWAGPHSRCYRTRVSNEILALLQDATGGELDFGVHKPVQFFLGHRLPLPCPSDLIPYLKGEHLPRLETFTRRARPAGVDNGRAFNAAPEPPLIQGTTYLHPDFAFGSVNRGSFWDQARSQVAYFGTRENPCWFRPRFLRDGIEFAAVQLYTAQKEDVALAAAVFATDGGTNHISLDRIQNATFTASDLRFRFEFGGTTAELETPADLHAPLTFQHGPLTINLQLLEASLGEITPRWESGHDEVSTYWDLVFHHGESADFHLGHMHRALLIWSLAIDSGEVALPAISIEESHGTAWAHGSGLEVRVPTAPCTLSELETRALSAQT